MDGKGKKMARFKKGVVLCFVLSSLLVVNGCSRGATSGDKSTESSPDSSQSITSSAGESGESSVEGSSSMNASANNSTGEMESSGDTNSANLSNSPGYRSSIGVSSGKSSALSSNGTSSTSSSHADPNYYTELLRPQFHFTAEKNFINDPNGLVYYKGEYHLFYQYTPDKNVSGEKVWGHAVSTDLMHWKHLPIAIQGDIYGAAWSGSAVVDTNDTSGFFNGGSGLVALYSYSSQKVGIAYSKDNGRTWTKHTKLAFSSAADANFRDPKVFWNASTKRWNMVIAGGQVRIYSSSNLIKWELESKLTSIETECPDLFQLPVDNNSSNKKWILSCSGREYFIGSFDGSKFTPESGKLTMNYGPDSYAAQSFYNAPNGRVIMLCWMNNSYCNETPDGVWNGALSMPVELSLKTVNGKLQVVQTPVKEFESLRKPLLTLSNKQVTAGANLLSGVSGKAFEIVAELQVDAAAKFNFKVRTGTGEETVISFDNTASKQITVDRSKSSKNGAAQLLNTQSVVSFSAAPHSNIIRLRMLVDWSSLEVYCNNGEQMYIGRIQPAATSQGMSLNLVGGTVKVNSLSVNEIKSVWR